jgi:hypothetical protein
MILFTHLTLAASVALGASMEARAPARIPACAQAPAAGLPAARVSRAGRTVVPFELVDNRIVIPVRVNGHGPRRFILDTGAGAGIDTDALDALGIAAGAPTSIGGVGEQSRAASVVTLQEVRVGDIRLAEVRAFASSFAADFEPVFGSYRIDGVIGQPLFARYVVEIDYGRCVVTFIDPRTYTPAAGSSVVPLDFAGHLPLVRATLDGVDGVFGLDTGARTAIILYGPFVDRNGLRAKYAPEVEAITGWGIGGPVRSQVARIRTLTLGTPGTATGDVTVRDLVARLSTQRAGLMATSSRAGLIGPDVLKQFVTTFDYGRRELILRRSAAYGVRDTYDRSGMWIAQRGRELVVLDVVADGPAEAAGLRVGDVVLAVDGVAADALVLPTVRHRMRVAPPGTRVRLRLASGGRRRETTLVLRDLV